MIDATDLQKLTNLLNGIKVNSTQIGARLNRLQHLVKELAEGIVELENDLSQLDEEMSKERNK